MKHTKEVLVFGATGNMGGAATRELLGRGWRVRAVTRDPESEKAQALSGLGADLVQADMEDRSSLEAAFDGIRRVFSVQNWVTGGVEGEVRQGKLVAEVARSAGIEQLVYGSAGTGEPDTGVPHFQAKIEVEAHMRKLGLPFAVVRPGPFMELMTEKEFYPALGIWGVKPRIVGWHTPVPWVAVQDIGIAIANIFQDFDAWSGRVVELFGDVRSLAECQATYMATYGKKPARVPLPTWLFNKMAGPEFALMWQWMASWIVERGPDSLWQIVETSRQLSPGLLDVERWLAAKIANEVEAAIASQAMA